jgi:hypothetical protein
MKTNVGAIDKSLRILGGATLLLQVLLGTLHSWAWLAVWPLVTGMAEYCPLYQWFGIDTRKRPQGTALALTPAAPAKARAAARVPSAGPAAH